MDALSIIVSAVAALLVAFSVGWRAFLFCKNGIFLAKARMNYH